MGRLLARSFSLAALAFAALPASAPAAPSNSALGVPCQPWNGGVRYCSASIATLVPSWDGIPLDVDVWLPPSSVKPPYPLIVGIHGFATNKLLGLENPATAAKYASRGFAVLTYSARGIGFSCGLPVTRVLPACARGWIHLADARYEVRDTQYLAGLLVDEGWVKPRIGVTGSSYGGGQSLMLATLRDRVMLPDGRLIRWRSPQGTPMEIAAAAPKIGWSDLAYALVPSGRTLDYRARNPYGSDVGVVKQSYLEGLYAVGLATGWYAPPGADPSADITTWKLQLALGDPYPASFARNVLTQFKRYHSAYYIFAAVQRSRRRAPAPMVIYNGWLDDIMSPSEALRYYTRVKSEFPGARIGLVFTDGFAHNRGSLVGDATLPNRQRDLLFARYLRGDRDAHPLNGALVKTVGCNGAPSRGPFRTRTWRAQHPGEIRVSSSAPQTFSSTGGRLFNSVITDPFFSGSECPGTSAANDPGAATYLTAPARGGGFTLVGSPTVVARLRVQGSYPQVDSRLWDVAPNGRQTFVTHGIYRPAGSGRQVFQTMPTAWHFAAGHRAKLELLGRDQPWAQPSNASFEITISNLTLELPVRQRPGSPQVRRYTPPRP